MRIAVFLPTISVSQDQTLECELTDLSGAAVDAATHSSSVAERWRPAVVAVAVSFIVTNLEQESQRPVQTAF